jgi:hypothetical protein
MEFEDPEGELFEDQAAALIEASAQACLLASECLRFGRPLAFDSIIVRDETRVIAGEVQVREAVLIALGGGVARGR